MKGLDHIVWCVDDLGAAAQVFRDLGFVVTPRARHPFGTHNCLVQLDGFFIELLCVAEPGKITSAAPGNFSFAAFNKQFLRYREGISMLVLDSSDFRADHARTVRAELETYEPFEFSRMARLPDGSTQQVSFGLNFNTSAEMPDLAFFTCQQFAPQYFWFEAYQRHANTAHSIEEVALVASEPRRHERFLREFSDCPVSLSSDDEVRISTVRGDIAVYTPAHYSQRFDMQQSVTDDTDVRFAAVVVGVTDASVIDNRVSRLFGADLLFQPVTDNL